MLNVRQQIVVVLLVLFPGCTTQTLGLGVLHSAPYNVQIVSSK